MTASTAPTQPPDNCPACNATGKEEMYYGHPAKLFECGIFYFWKNDGHDWRPHADHDCREAFSAAIALRAELAEVKQANHVLSHQLERRADGMDDLTQHLRAERDAALARGDVYRNRALAVFKALKRNTSHERAWDRSYEELTDLVWERMDEFGIPREHKDSTNKQKIYNSFNGRLQLTGEKFKAMEAELTAARARLAELQAVVRKGHWAHGVKGTEDELQPGRTDPKKLDDVREMVAREPNVYFLRYEIVLSDKEAASALASGAESETK